MKKFIIFIIIFITIVGVSFAAPGAQTGTTINTNNYKFEFNPNDISDSVALGFTGARYDVVGPKLQAVPIGEIKAEIGKLAKPDPKMTFKAMSKDTASYDAHVFYYGKVRSLNPYKISFELTNLQPVDQQGVVIPDLPHFKITYDFVNLRVNYDGKLVEPAPPAKQVTVAASASSNSKVDLFNVPGIFDGQRHNLTSWFFGKINILATGVKFPDEGTWSGTVTMKFIVQ